MKYQYTFTRADKTIQIQMSDTTMLISERYPKMGYKVSKREVWIDGRWLDVEELINKFTNEII